MESKFKVGLLQINLLLAALLTAWQALYSQHAMDAALLWMATLWLSITASQVATPHRRPISVPWQLLPGLLLVTLLLASPERHLSWLWAWAVLIMLPQPRWIMLFNLLLATITWASLLTLIGVEQWALSGILLTLMMLLGLSRSLELQALRRGIRHRARLLPGLSLWPAARLQRDLKLERRRLREEQSHGELVMIRARRMKMWSLAESLCRQALPFERCYRLDQHTLGLMLISRDAESAITRRQTLQASLPQGLAMRCVALERLGPLDEECQRLRSSHHLTGDALGHGAAPIHD